MRIYLAGAQGYLPTCRQVRGKNVGLLVSFYGLSFFQLRKMLKVLTFNVKPEK